MNDVGEEIVRELPRIEIARNSAVGHVPVSMSVLIIVSLSNNVYLSVIGCCRLPNLDRSGNRQMKDDLRLRS